MSLRVRLITSIVVVLLVSLCAGGAVAGWHAVRSVRAEMQAALVVGVQTLRNGIDDLPGLRDRPAELGRLVHMFDGDRHLLAVLKDATGRLNTRSTPARLTPKAPAWFISLLTPSIAPVHLDASAGNVITVETDPRNEVGEVWTQLQDDLVAVGLCCGLSLVLVTFVVGRALQPLDRLSAALALLGSGEYTVRVEHAGPPELLRLGSGFNAMAERLEEAGARNLRLNDQLLTLQEEERTDLARDLHDEVGPFLFAVHLDAASIEQAVASGQIAEVPERARAIREAVAHMQRHVRAMLHRLRPASPVEVGLAPALGNLVTFWRARQPAIEFVLAVSIDDDAVGEPTLAAIYRLVQEGLNNSVRHGRPRRIEVIAETSETGDICVRVTDDGTGPDAFNEPGLGLTGMQERVRALGGTLSAGAGRDGFVVMATLPSGAMMEEV
jgi:two-component system, NarL family, sensor histidine kinase UhpB